jgi:ABC-type Zn uptake system ZnuABC Zn-binding protein ZnuA
VQKSRSTRSLLPATLSFSALIVTALGALVLTGCASNVAQSAPHNDGKLKIVATTTQVADFTRNIVGSDAVVTQLVQPNQSAHNYDPSPADLTTLGKADVVVVNGHGLETWLTDIIAASGFAGTTIDTSEGIDVSGHGNSHDHQAQTNERETAPALRGHDHPEDNPHIWMDVWNAKTQVHNIEKGVTQVDPENGATYMANADAYEIKLTSLDQWIRTNIDAVPVEQRLFVSNHDAFEYFTAAYGINYVGSVIPGFDDNAEPNAAEIDRLVAAIKQTGAKAVFSEKSLNPKAADTIAREAGVMVYSGDNALYADSLGAAGSGGETYIASQLHNVTLLLTSWGATPSRAPTDLHGA